MPDFSVMFAAPFPERGLSRDRLDSLIEEQDADRIAQAALRDHVRLSKPAWKLFVSERWSPASTARGSPPHAPRQPPRAILKFVQTAQPAPITHPVRTQSRLPDVTQPPPNQHGAAFVPLESRLAPLP